MFDLESKTSYHLRITGERDDCIEMLQKFNDKWSAEKLIAGYEEVDENHHVHAHIQFDEKQAEYHDSDKGKSARSALFKKYNFAGLYNFQKLVKPPKNNICYVVKDLDVCVWVGISDEDIDEINEWNADIEKSKKQDQREKILEAITIDLVSYLKTYDIQMNKLYQLQNEEEIDQYTNLKRDLESGRSYRESLTYIAEFISKLYIREYNKEPPLNQMRQYTLYVAQKLSDDDDLRLIAGGSFGFYERQIEWFYTKMFQ